MPRITLWVCVGVLVWSSGSCSVKCPDGHQCFDASTCCLTGHGFSCCPFPKAVCCADKAHCCPSGYRCNLTTMMCEKTDQPWMSIPMRMKEEAAEEPASHLSPLTLVGNKNVPEVESTIVHCDNQYACPDHTTCCRHPKGAWFCCPYSPGRCCLDGYHCCPYGYDCDLTYTHCVRDGLRYPFAPKRPPASVPASPISPPDNKLEKPLTAVIEATDSPMGSGVTRCDDTFFCESGTSCCKGSAGKWTCCPYPLGTCCPDGKHCCQYGYTCDPGSTSCRRWGAP